MILQIDARISILRGDVRDMAGAAIASFKINDRDEAQEFLLEGLTYIYPIDLFVSPPHLLHCSSLTLTQGEDRPKQPAIPPPGH